ncbi:MAG: EamA family transporter, partial [Vulcanimicrobiaceae bacterium]
MAILLDQTFAERNARGPAPLIRFATLGGAQIFVGAAAIFARFALGGAGPLAVSYLRLGIAATIVLLLLLARGGDGRSGLGPRREAVLAVAGAALAVHFAGWIASLEYTSIAVATLLVCTSPLFTGIATAISSRRLPSVAFGLALLCGAAGLALVVDARGAAAPIAGHEILGAFLAALGGAAMAVYLMLVRSVRSNLTTLAIVARTYTWAAIVLVPIAFFARESPPPFAATGAWAGILAMAFISQLGGHTAI